MEVIFIKDITVNVNRDYNYNIVIQKGLLQNLDCFKDIFDNYGKVIIISDTNVAKLYLNDVMESIKSMGCVIHEIIIDSGEKSKTLDKAYDIYEKLLQYNATRGDLMIALGGGVVGDLTGYCASTYLRGLDFIQIPTSLLAQVDSSVGGKVGVNLKQGKNLIGSFYQPKLVIIDSNTLQTLPERVFADGMAEVIKYGCIYDDVLFEKLLKINKNNLMEIIDEVIETCCNIKKEVVEKDEMEKNLRRILNFGHTLGHVVESYFHLEKYTHGESVALGMYAFAQLGEKKGITKVGTSSSIKSILKKYGLPTDFPKLDRDKVLDIVSKDKKFEGSHIHLVLLECIGKTKIQTIENYQIEEYILNRGE
ncbi:3-dehydroquinate synthase [Alkalibaculum sp. M08DMB]|uniref:3-dehydroquinate synthase n=1 Tax=Alkalibaculum sporogenes TaxID=2655001 RepID=A0A6A7K9Z7_9FIRM|nr:3-dehydroquinate synthase [Alkalibaculum sporogenes]MPW26216.1 3-dehydroquinate synthase [Alkalibaculum sporogenes]